MTWAVLANEDSRGAELADRHYSRQTPGARGFMPPGRRFALWQPGVLWCVVWNLDPLGTPRWRNTLFRNETVELSSGLIRSALAATITEWRRRYGTLPAERLTTEVDVDKTATRRSRSARPGRSYRGGGLGVPRHQTARAAARAARRVGGTVVTAEHHIVSGPQLELLAWKGFDREHHEATEGAGHPDQLQRDGRGGLSRSSCDPQAHEGHRPIPPCLHRVRRTRRPAVHHRR